LEFTDEKNLLSRENYYIKTFKPAYNVLNRAKVSVSLKGNNNRAATTVEVLDLTNNKTTIYSSIRKAARELRVNYSTVYRAGKTANAKPVIGRFVITFIQS
jgi:excinuclease UvrABC nuclease subunit